MKTNLARSKLSGVKRFFRTKEANMRATKSTVGVGVVATRPNDYVTKKAAIEAERKKANAITTLRCRIYIR